jgi:nitroreductase
MDAIKAIIERKVSRSFARNPVDPALLVQIVDAGRHAMSARNLQPWQFIVIEDAAQLRRIGALCTTGKFVADAPAAIVVLKDSSNTRWADIDCAQAVQNMATAAWSLGLGTCWVGNYDGPQIAHILGVPDSWAIFTILPFGYPDNANPPQGKPLKARSQVVHFERYGDNVRS